MERSETVVVVFEFLREHVRINGRFRRLFASLNDVVERSEPDLRVQKQQVEQALFGVRFFKELHELVRVLSVPFADQPKDLFTG